MNHKKKTRHCLQLTASKEIKTSVLQVLRTKSSQYLNEQEIDFPLSIEKNSRADTLIFSPLRLYWISDLLNYKIINALF